MPFKPFDLQPNRTEAIWLVLYVPLDAQPGQYEGQVRVIAENQTISLPLQVEVVPLTLPEETELKVIFDLRGAIVGRLLAEPERLKGVVSFPRKFSHLARLCFARTNFPLRKREGHDGGIGL
jgi:hypothetical protein